MSDEATDGKGDEKPPANEQKNQAPPADDFDKERAMATIQKLREAEKQGKQAAKELAEAQARLKEIEDAQKTETEKLAAKVAEYETREQDWQREKRESAIKLAVFAKSAELADVDLVLAALDRDAIEYADDGTPRNVDDVLGALLEAKPLLKANGKPEPPKPGNLNAGDGQGQGPAPALTAEELAAAQETGTRPEVYAAMKGVQTLADYQAAQERLKAAT